MFPRTADEENGVPFEALRRVQRSERHAIEHGSVLGCSPPSNSATDVGHRLRLRRPPPRRVRPAPPEPPSARRVAAHRTEVGPTSRPRERCCLAQPQRGERPSRRSAGRTAARRAGRLAHLRPIEEPLGASQHVRERPGRRAPPRTPPTARSPGTGSRSPSRVCRRRSVRRAARDGGASAGSSGKLTAARLRAGRALPPKFQAAAGPVRPVAARARIRSRARPPAASTGSPAPAGSRSRPRIALRESRQVIRTPPAKE